MKVRAISGPTESNHDWVRPIGEDPDVPPSELPTRWDYEWLAELDAEQDRGVPCPASS